MITQYRFFKDVNGRDIANCSISSDKKITAEGAFENDNDTWVQLNQIDLIVTKIINGMWEYFGTFQWTGATALKTNTIYNINTNAINLSEGVYGLTNFDFKTTPPVGGLYYHNGNFDLKFKQ